MTTATNDRATRGRATRGRTATDAAIRARVDWESLGDSPQRLARYWVGRIAAGGMRRGKKGGEQPAAGGAASGAAGGGDGWTSPIYAAAGETEERAAECVATAYRRWRKWRDANPGEMGEEELLGKIGGLVRGAAMSAVFTAASRPALDSAGIDFELIPSPDCDGGEMAARVVQRLAVVSDELAELAVGLMYGETESQLAASTGQAKGSIARRKKRLASSPIVADLAIAVWLRRLVRVALGD